MIDCAIINDLIFVYISGEASPQTKKLVEDHLLACPDCAKAIEQARQADQLLEAWETPLEKPASGPKFIGRLQGLIFIGGTLFFSIFTVAAAIWHRFVLLEILQAEQVQLQLPVGFVFRTTPLQIWLTAAAILLIGGWYWIDHNYPKRVPKWIQPLKGGLYALLSLFAYSLTGQGEMPGILIGGISLTLLFGLAIRWRWRQPPDKRWVAWLRSTITAVPLFGLILATINVIVGWQTPGIFIAPTLLLLALVETHRHLAKLPYMLNLTLIAMLLANSLLAWRGLQVLLSLVTIR